MLRRVQQALFILFALLLLYLLLVRLMISWVQLAPEYFFSFAEKMTQSTIQVDDVHIEQNWLGLSFSITNLVYVDNSSRLSLESGRGDINIFSPLLPDVRLGRQIELSKVRYQLLQKPSPNNEVPHDAYTFLQTDWHTWSTHRLWKVIKLNDISVSFQDNVQAYHTEIESFQSYQGIKWSFGGVVNFAVGDSVSSRIQIQGDFSVDKEGLPNEGTLSSSILSPINLNDIYSLMTRSWSESLPSGEFVGDVSLEMEKGELSKLRVTSNFQGLAWQQNDRLLPKSIGLSLNWVATNYVSGSSFDNWRFEIEKIRFGHEYLKTISPIFLSMEDNSFLRVEASELDLTKIKPIFNVVMAKIGYEGFGNNLAALKMKDLIALVDLKTLSVPVLKLIIPEFDLPSQRSFPGITSRELTVEKMNQDISIKSIYPINFSLKEPYKKIIQLHLNEGLHWTLDEAKNHWAIQKNKFLLENIPVELNAQGNFSGDIDIDISLEPKEMSVVKAYLPYSLMSPELESWFKTALVKGTGIKGKVNVVGNLNDFPFDKGRGVFTAEAEVRDAILKFQPDWPAVSELSAKLFFSPYKLKIIADKAKLLNVNVSNIQVELKDLDQENIALQISAQAKSKTEDALAFFQATPLVGEIGIESFLSEDIKANGNISVDLEKIWVPVYGYNKRTEKVKGHVVMENVDLNLFDSMSLTNTQGQVDFTESSVSARKVTSQFLGGQVSIDIKTQQDAIRLLAKGKTHDPSIFYQGQLPWNVDLKIPMKKNNAILLDVDADFRKVKSLLPAPLDEVQLNKLKGQEGLKVNLNIGANQILINAGLGQFLNTKIKLEHDHFVLLNVAFGESNVRSQRHLEKGFVIKGQMETLDIDGWLDFYEQLDKKYGAGGQKITGLDQIDLWNISTLAVNKALYKENVFNNLNMNWSGVQKVRHGQKDYELALSLKGDDVELIATQFDNQNIEVQLSKLEMAWPKAEETSQRKDFKCSPNSSSVLLPNIKFSGKNIHIDDRYFSNLNFTLKDTPQELSVEDASVEFGQVNGKLNAHYHYDKAKKHSYLKADIRTNNVQDITKLLDVKKGFKGKEGEVSTQLDWKGSYDCYSLIRIKGKLDFKFNDGVIKDAEPGLARLIGLLSFESLARRLQLDVKDVTSQGLAYESISGSGRVHRGILGFERLELKAPAASANVFGEVNLVQEQFDLSAEITPAIGSTFPAIAAISGVATPLAGLAAYALLKVVPIVNEDLVTYRYEISGTFDHPKIKDKGLNLDIINFKGQSGIQGDGILDAE